MAPTIRSQRYLLTVEYIGSSFLGWQKQKTGRTVQGVLEEAFEKFLNHPVTISGSSRTDTGVHALGNTAHVEFERTSKRHPGEALPPHDSVVVKRAVNHFLGQTKSHDVALVDVQCIPSTVHSRFAARERVYCYRMTSSSEPLSIFDQDRTWHVSMPLNLQAMKEACALLEGHHDFSSFRASGCQAKSPMRTLDELSISEIPSWSLFTPSLMKSAAVMSEKDQRSVAPGPPILGELPSCYVERDNSGENSENGDAMLPADADANARDAACDPADERGHDQECQEGKGVEVAVGNKRPGLLAADGSDERDRKRPSSERRAPGRLDTHSSLEGRSNGSKESSSRRGMGGPVNFVMVARARSFLYHQVRLMVGLIKAVGCGERSVSDVKRILEARTPTAAPPMAPACGLYLARVGYQVNKHGFMVEGDDPAGCDQGELHNDSGSKED